MTCLKTFFTYLNQYHVQQCFDIFFILFGIYFYLAASSIYLAGWFAFFAVMSGIFIYRRQISHQAS